MYKEHTPFFLIASVLTLCLYFIIDRFTNDYGVATWILLYTGLIIVFRPIKEMRTLKFDANELIKMNTSKTTPPVYWLTHVSMFLISVFALVYLIFFR